MTAIRRSQGNAIESHSSDHHERNRCYPEDYANRLMPAEPLVENQDGDRVDGDELRDRVPPGRATETWVIGHRPNG
ncbi:hypothetical protein [Rhizobium laguerreae]|uniref:hypothetical protein n=1 Tax=Rhizobium laguerreae TaxID=1076926 RepID=UPI001C9156DB|nr:hypothetical protein [Rhizobium laguerreae]MBY3250528.1 hypothetical protein [Rhizobium laguerreae]